MREVRIKSGEALSMRWTFTSDGDPVDITNATLASQVRDPAGDLVATLPVTTTGVPGEATVYLASTPGWPIGLLSADIVVSAGGGRLVTETFGIRVLRGVTA